MLQKIPHVPDILLLLTNLLAQDEIITNKTLRNTQYSYKLPSEKNFLT